ncbi:MAG: efflux RND transporter permease subunit [Candidatus Obscuribacterales bacterium]|nr:efflux RND transporter permease subunit [Candidatus Obscuribacterales bacterium]
MWIIGTAMRRPLTVMVAILSIALAAIMAMTSMKQDIFPDLDIPAINIIQGYGGMSPAQMEGYIVSSYELFFLYVPGIEHIESQSIQNLALIKIFFQPGTDMATSMATCVAMANRATSVMPKGTLNPFVLRFDPGCLPVGQLVLSSNTKSVREMQDLAYVRIRSALATVPGVQSPPPFGGNVRTIVLNVDADKLRQYNISGKEIIEALNTGNVVTPAGNVRTGDLMRIAPVDTDLPDIKMLEYLPIRTGHGPQIFVRDVGRVEDSEDILAGYAMYQGKHTVYLPVVKRSDASTVAVVQAIREALPRMQNDLPPDVKISYEFDQSKHVTDAIQDVLFEGLLGTILPGLMILLFLRDLRSTFIVVTTIPASLLASCVCLWITGQTINIQTLSGLALSIGILVDEATVTIENIHSHLAKGKPVSRAVLEAGGETMVPSFLAMLSVIAVFVPSFFMTGITKHLFIPLSLAVGFAMVASFLLSITMVPVLSVWLLKQSFEHHAEDEGFFAKIQKGLGRIIAFMMPMRFVIVPAYIAACLLGSALLFLNIGREIFPPVGGSEFRMRISAPTGTRVEVLEKKILKTIDIVKEVAGPENLEATLGYAGQQPPNFVISSVFLWTSGPHQGVMDFRLKEEAHIDMNKFKDEMRKRLAKEMPDVLFSFEPGDLVSQIMNLGSPTPISVQIKGHDLTLDKVVAEKVRKEMAKIPHLRDLQYGQAQDYPTCDIKIDRELAGQLGLTPEQIGYSLLPAMYSSRYIHLSFWKDPKSGVSYQVQVQVPQDQIKSKQDIEEFPAMASPNKQHPLIRDVASVEYGTTAGEYDRYNMARMVSLTANIAGADLARVGAEVEKAVAAVGKPPLGVTVEVKGQVPLLDDTFNHLFGGLGLAVVVIFLMLTAYFQSPRLVAVVLSTVPAIILGVMTILTLTNTTLNVQSFMGAIMSVGVGVSNALLLVVFAEKNRKEGIPVEEAVIKSAEARMRPILMTSIAMVAGMIPMAVTPGQSAPLGRAVMGGIIMSTLAALTVLPLVFVMIQERASLKSPSLHPEDRGE